MAGAHRRGAARRVRFAASLSLAVVAVAAVAAVAGAQADRRFALERLRLALDRDGILDVEWGAVPEHGGWDVGLLVAYADEPWVASEGVETPGSPLRRRFGGSLVGAVGLWGRFEMGAELPFVAHQARRDAAAGPEPASAGLGDLRLAPRVQAIAGAVDVAVAPAFTLPTGAGDEWLGERGATFAPEIAVSHALVDLRLAVNLGWRLRGDAGAARPGDELFWRAGVAYRFREDPPREVAFTLSGATDAQSPYEDPRRSPFEALLGLAYALSTKVSLLCAAGTGLADGTWGTPDWRVLAGVRVGWREQDHDRDGIRTVEDACPREAEDYDGFYDADGCPEPDNDRDGVPDALDGCPSRAGPAARRGCPDERAN